MSSTVSPDSWYGTILKGTVNFTPTTTWLQLVCWLAYIVPVMTLLILRVRRPVVPHAGTATLVDRPSGVATSSIDPRHPVLTDQPEQSPSTRPTATTIQEQGTNA